MRKLLPVFALVLLASASTAAWAGTRTVTPSVSGMT